MCQIAGVDFKHNVWNSAVPLSKEKIQHLLESETGAVVLKTCTLEPRRGQPNNWVLHSWGSFNRVSLDNNGIDSLISDLAELVLTKPIFFSIYGTESELLKMLEKINNLHYSILVEWNISCPNVKNVKNATNIENINYSATQYLNLKKNSRYPLGIKIGYQQQVDFLDKVDFVTAINTIGGTGGAVIRKNALEFIQELSLRTTTPLIGVGGVQSWSDILAFLAAGATAVEIGTEFLRQGTKIFCPPSRYKRLIQSIQNKQILRRGTFILSSGLTTNYYVNFRQLFSYPDIFSSLLEQAEDRLKTVSFHALVGVPSGGLPLASCLALRLGKPLFLYQQTVKTHGIYKVVYGDFENYKSNKKCLIVDDVFTTGNSIYKVAIVLEKQKLVVTDGFVILNRSAHKQFGSIRIHSLFHIQNLLNPIKIVNSFSENKFTKLFQLIQDKNSKLCFAADIKNVSLLLEIVEKVGPYICMLKLHADILSNLTNNFYRQLTILSRKHQFMILLDNKFSDIARIVLLQAERWSSYIPIDFVTAHACSGRKTIEILAKKYGVFIVAEMSSAANDYVYIRQAVELALDYNCGLVAQRRLDNKLPHLVPGVSLDRRTDLLGQNYKSPSEIDFADIVVVGEGIYNAENIEKSAQKYQMLLCAKIKTKL